MRLWCIAPAMLFFAVAFARATDTLAVDKKAVVDDKKLNIELQKIQRGETTDLSVLAMELGKNRAGTDYDVISQIDDRTGSGSSLVTDISRFKCKAGASNAIPLPYGHPCASTAQTSGSSMCNGAGTCLQCPGDACRCGKCMATGSVAAIEGASPVCYEIKGRAIQYCVSDGNALGTCQKNAVCKTVGDDGSGSWKAKPNSGAATAGGGGGGGGGCLAAFSRPGFSDAVAVNFSSPCVTADGRVGACGYDISLNAAACIRCECPYGKCLLAGGAINSDGCPACAEPPSCDAASCQQSVPDTVKGVCPACKAVRDDWSQCSLPNGNGVSVSYSSSSSSSSSSVGTCRGGVCEPCDACPQCTGRTAKSPEIGAIGCPACSAGFPGGRCVTDAANGVGVCIRSGECVEPYCHKPGSACDPIAGNYSNSEPTPASTEWGTCGMSGGCDPCPECGGCGYRSPMGEAYASGKYYSGSGTVIAWSDAGCPPCIVKESGANCSIESRNGSPGICDGSGEICSIDNPAYCRGIGPCYEMNYSDGVCYVIDTEGNACNTSAGRRGKCEKHICVAREIVLLLSVLYVDSTCSRFGVSEGKVLSLIPRHDGPCSLYSGNKCVAESFCDNRTASCIASKLVECPKPTDCSAWSCLFATGECVPFYSPAGKACRDRNGQESACDGKGACAELQCPVALHRNTSAACSRAVRDGRGCLVSVEPLVSDEPCDTGSPCRPFGKCSADGTCSGNPEASEGSECAPTTRECARSQCRSGECVVTSAGCDDGIECTADRCAAVASSGSSELKYACISSPDDSVCAAKRPCYVDPRCAPSSSKATADGCAPPNGQSTYTKKPRYSLCPLGECVGSECAALQTHGCGYAEAYDPLAHECAKVARASPHQGKSPAYTTASGWNAFAEDLKSALIASDKIGEPSESSAIATKGPVPSVSVAECPGISSCHAAADCDANPCTIEAMSTIPAAASDLPWWCRLASSAAGNGKCPAKPPAKAIPCSKRANRPDGTPCPLGKCWRGRCEGDYETQRRVLIVGARSEVRVSCARNGALFAVFSAEEVAGNAEVSGVQLSYVRKYADGTSSRVALYSELRGKALAVTVPPIFMLRKRAQQCSATLALVSPVAGFRFAVYGTVLMCHTDSECGGGFCASDRACAFGADLRNSTVVLLHQLAGAGICVRECGTLGRGSMWSGSMCAGDGSLPPIARAAMAISVGDDSCADCGACIMNGGYMRLLEKSCSFFGGKCKKNLACSPLTGKCGKW